MVNIPLCTPEEYQYGWKHSREAKCHLSGVHFGHYNAAVEDIIRENQPFDGNYTNANQN